MPLADEHKADDDDDDDSARESGASDVMETGLILRGE
jgi:hypothetical protein